MEFSILGILSVVLELFRPILLPLAIVIALDLLLFARVLRRHNQLNVNAGIKRALGLGAIVGVATALYLPAWTGSSLAQLQSVIDYIAIIGGGIGVGVAVGILAYPPLQLMVKKSH